jgi:hypothetical protein
MRYLEQKPFFLIFFLAALFGSGLAQNYNNLFQLYEDRKMEQLAGEAAKLSVNDASEEVRFFRALFIENGETASEIYKELITGKNARVRYYSAVKLASYFYARGYYITSERYSKIAAGMNLPPLESTAPQPGVQSNFAIQVGAFGMRDNANQLRDMLATQNIDSRVVERELGTQLLFCVWINGSETREATTSYAEELKEKYRLEYRIIDTN